MFGLFARREASGGAQLHLVLAAFALLLILLLALLFLLLALAAVALVSALADRQLGRAAPAELVATL